MQEDLVGTVLDGTYALVRVIGRGGMGGVYEAMHLEDGQRYAVKVIAGELLDDPTYLERFRREALAASQLGHPHIVRTYDHRHPEGGAPYLVMELLEGRSLREILKAEDHLAPRRAVTIIMQLLSALQAAHDAGIIHRDLKPDNVLLVDGPEGETVKLLDFGIAKIMTADLRMKLTQTGMLVGTPRYAAPEQLMSSRHVDARTDVYAAAGLLYCALSGRPPFLSSGARLLVDIEEKEPTDPRIQVPTLDPALIEVMRRAMNKDQGARYPTARAFAEALRPFLTSPEHVSLDTIVDERGASRRKMVTKVFSSRPPKPAVETQPMPARRGAKAGAGAVVTKPHSPRALGLAPSPEVSDRPDSGTAPVDTLPDPPEPATPATKSSSPPPRDDAPPPRTRQVAVAAPTPTRQVGGALPRTVALPAAELPTAADWTPDPEPESSRPPAPTRGGSRPVAIALGVALAVAIGGGSVVLGMQMAEERREAEASGTPATCAHLEDLACGSCVHLGRCVAARARAASGDDAACNEDRRALEAQCHGSTGGAERGVVPPPPIGDETCDRYARAACSCGSGEALRERCHDARVVVVGQAPTPELVTACRVRYERLPEACRR